MDANLFDEPDRPLPLPRPAESPLKPSHVRKITLKSLKMERALRKNRKLRMSNTDASISIPSVCDLSSQTNVSEADSLIFHFETLSRKAITIRGHIHVSDGDFNFF